MATLDASSLAQMAVRLRLISEQQWQECSDEIDSPNSPPEVFLRVMERKGYLTPWQASKLLKGETDGYFLGGYRLLYRIAAGTFGRVYRADHPSNGEVVAIKVLRRKWSGDQHKIELFEREGKVGMSLNHPNIVQILNVGKDASTSQYYIVMEFVEGGNLRDILGSQKKLGADESLRILEECASGLAYAYTRGLTHRDIKPSNILISTQRTAKLVDFGLAEITGSAIKEEDDTHVDRTVDYAGLERATGTKVGDSRSDIYFLGCVFYEMVTGRPLLAVTKDMKARMQPQRYEVLRGMRRDDPDLPPPLYSLLQRMSAFEPLERLQSAAQLVEMVRQTRREITGEIVHEATPTGPKTIYIVEHHPKLQDAFRDRFREMGYKVLITTNSSNAVQRYQQNPYHVLIVDAGTAGEEGLEAFDQVMWEAEKQRLNCAGIMILSETQAEWRDRLRNTTNATILVRPVTLKQITKLIRDAAPLDEKNGE
jgi:serine/threonine protein kinase